MYGCMHIDVEHLLRNDQPAAVDAGPAGLGAQAGAGAGGLVEEPEHAAREQDSHRDLGSVQNSQVCVSHITSPAGSPRSQGTLRARGIRREICAASCPIPQEL